MGQYAKLAKNSFFFAIGSFSSRAITFLLLPVYTRYLTPEEYGIIDVLLTTILLLTPILSIQAQEISFRYSMDKDIKLESTLMNSFIFCVGGFGIVLILSPFLPEFQFFSDYSTIFYIVLFLAMIDSVFKQFSRGIGRIKQFVASDIIYSSTFAVSIFTFIVVLDFDIDGYLFSLLLGYLLSSLFLFAFGGVGSNFTLQGIDISLIKPMIQYSAPLIPTAIMWWTINMSDRYLLSYFIDFNANGIYAIASKIPVILVTFNAVFFKAWQITAIEGYSNIDFKEVFEKIFNSLTIVLFLLFSVIIMFLKPLFALLATGDFYSGWQYVPALLVGVIFSAYSQFWGVVYIASKKTIGALITAFFGAGLNVLLNVILIPIYGIFGAAIATMLSFFGMWLSRIYHIRDTEKIFVNFKYVLLNLSLISVQVIALFNFNGIEYYIISLVIMLVIILVNLRLIRDNFSFIKNIILKRFK